MGGGLAAAGFDVVLDKGTFDAVCLSGEMSGGGGGGGDDDGDRERKRRVCEEYPARVARLVRPDTGRLVVTSCCWTEAELRRWFEDGEGGDGGTGLKACDRIEYPSFVFGGRKGTCLACVVFYRPLSSRTLSEGKI